MITTKLVVPTDLLNKNKLKGFETVEDMLQFRVTFTLPKGTWTNEVKVTGWKLLKKGKFNSEVEVTWNKQ